MLVTKGNDEGPYSSARISTDLFVYPPPMNHDSSSLSTVFLSNNDSNDKQADLKHKGDPVELEIEDLELLGIEGRKGADQGLCRRYSKKAFRLYRNNVGLLLIIAAQAFLACMNLFAKLLTASDVPVPALELIWIQMTITYFCCMTYMLVTKVEYPWTGPPGIRWLLIIRGALGFFGLFGIYYSLQYLTLSDATVLTFLSPTLTGVFGHFLLKELFSRRQAVAGLFSLFGVVLIARPVSLFGSDGMDEKTAEVDSAQRLAAVGVSLLGVMGSAGAYTSMRAIGKKANALHTLAYYSLFCVIVSSVLMVFQRVPVVIPSSSMLLLFLFLIGIFGFIAQTLIVMGFQIETASRGSMGIYTLILFTGAMDQIVLRTRPVGLSVVGAIIITSSAIYTAITKQISPDEKAASKRVRWVEDLEAFELRSDYEEFEEVHLNSQTGTQSELSLP